MLSSSLSLSQQVQTEQVTYFIIMNKIAHTSQKVGLASAMAVVLLLIILICAALQKLFFEYIFKDSSSDDEEL